MGCGALCSDREGSRVRPSMLCSCERSVCLSVFVGLVVCVCACWEYTRSLGTGWTWDHGAAAGWLIWPHFSLTLFFPGLHCCLIRLGKGVFNTKRALENSSCNEMEQ